MGEFMQGNDKRRGNGTISRRAFAAMAMAAVAAPARSQSSGIRVAKLHCFEIRVADVERSVEFYQRLLGMPVQARTPGRVCLGIGAGPQFMAIRAAQAGEAPAITYIGYSVRDFDAAAVLTELQRAGFGLIEAPAPSAAGIENAMKCWRRDAGGVEEVYFADPRGLIVQLCSPSYCGTADRSCAAERDVAGALQLRDINHFTVFLNDGGGANRFYQDFFGLSVQAFQGPQAPVTGIGDGYQFVMYAGAPSAEPSPALIHHACFSMPAFDVETVLDTLTEQGLSARADAQTGPLMHYVSLRMPERGGAEGGTPELYFTDPDGILMQLQDVSYCGGGGYLGEQCLSG
jgi:catechol 2,3-dioxygenase-like lactoylglutathione lyase family enzyme